MRLREVLKDDSGFTLVEVILAVVILALVTLPLVNYFTYSGLRAADGRDKQTATMAAENVLDELNSYSRYEQIVGLLPEGDVPAMGSLTGEAWERFDTNTGENPEFMDIGRKVTINDMDFYARVHLNFTADEDGDGETEGYNSATKNINGGNLDADFNDYKIPKPSEIYSAGNVVAEEDDEDDIGISQLFLNSGAELDKGNIKNNVTRYMCTSVDYKKLDDGTYSDDIYNVKVYYSYLMGAGSAVLKIKPGQDTSTRVYLQDVDIKKDKLESIFLFYNAFDASSGLDNVVNLFGNESGKMSEQDVEKIKIYYACQNKSVLPSGYVLSRYNSTTNGLDGKANYYTNGISADFPLALKADGTPDGFVSAERQKYGRIARVTVRIFENSTDTADEDCVAKTESTIAE